MTSARKLKHILCAAAMLLSGAAARAEVAVEIPTMLPGETVEATVSVSNPAEATAMQFIITLPEGFTIPDGKLTLSDRAAGHSTEVNAKGTGEYRCVIYSTSNAPFEGTSGKLLSFGLKAPESAASGEYPILFSDIRYSDADGKETSGADATCMARIFIPVASITLDKSACNMAIGESIKLTATVAPEDATDSTVTWSSDNVEVASVTQDGIVTALAEGTAVISVRANDGSGVAASCIVNIGLPAAESVSVTPTEITLFPGQASTLTATVLPAAASQAVNWTSSSPAVATAASDGTVTAVAPGEATITATASDGSGKTAECKVTVLPILVFSITLDKEAASLKIGESITLKATVTPENATDPSLNWNSDNTEVATVTQDGKVTALTEGTAVITVKANDGSEAEALCVVNVGLPDVESVSVTPAELSLFPGQTSTLSATVLPAAASQAVNWTSSNTAIATVASDGTVTAVAPGEAIITTTASDGSGKKAECKVTVQPILVSSIKLEVENLELTLGESLILTATVTPEDATDRSVTWSSNNPETVRVNQEGIVTALDLGTAVISLTANDGSGAKAECTVTVRRPAPVAIVGTPQEFSIEKDSTLQLTATVVPAEASQEVEWSSNDPETATVTDNGLVTGLKEGTALIYVCSKVNPHTQTYCLLTVTDSNAVEFNPADNLHIEVESNEIRVIGKDASTIVEVYDMEGRILRSTKDTVISGLDKGVYIVAVGNYRIKIRI